MKQSYNMLKLVQKLSKTYDFNYKAGDGSCLTIRNVPFMNLLITAYAKDRVCVAHYTKQNGDVIYDPEIEYFIDPVQDRLYPVIIQTPAVHVVSFGTAGGYQEYVTAWSADENGVRWPMAYRKQKQAGLAEFSNSWAKTIRMQAFTDKGAVLERDDGSVLVEVIR